MKAIRLILLSLCLTVAVPGLSLTALADGNGDTTVYVTNTGKKYHRAGCSYLKSCHSISLEDAYIAGYGACSRCNPPAYTGTAVRGGKKDSSSYGSGSSSHSSGSSSPSGSGSISATKTETKEEKKTFPIGRVALGGLAFLIGHWYITAKRTRKREEEERRRKEEEERRRWEEEKERLLSELHGRSVREVARVPEGIRFLNGYPVDNNDSTYGSYTVYISENGKCYHRKAGCCSARKPRHIFQAQGYYSPCSKCSSGYRLKAPDWFYDYDRLQKECAKYRVDPGKEPPLLSQKAGQPKRIADNHSENTVSGSIRYGVYYCKNGEPVLITKCDSDPGQIMVYYRNQRYIRPVTHIGTEFFEGKP